MCDETKRLRFPAEWEPCRAVMIAWPHAATDWVYMLDEVEQCYQNLAQAIVEFADLIVVTPEPAHVEAMLRAKIGDLSRVTIAVTDTNDTWTRDYGPISTISEDGDKDLVVLNDFCFNGWGLKFAADLDNLVTRKLIFNEILGREARYRNELSFVLEGGSIESDGKGTLLTTRRCLLSPNRNGGLTRHEISRHLKDVLGVTKIHWLDHGALEGDDTDSHIDTLARLAPDDTIIYTGCENPADTHYAELSAMRDEIRPLRTAEGRPFNLIELPLPAAIHDEDGQRLPATYANYLVVNGGVLVPSYGQPKTDRLASLMIGSAYPGKKVVQVDCRALIRQHGSLHCATMQIL
ncbi:MAG: agmatine deiminase family protein [Muribaculaceae bacterium]